MAVYTRVSFKDADDFLGLYNLGGLRKITEIREGVENSNFFIETDSGKYVLTLFEKRVSSHDLPYYLELKEYLAGKGIPCPVPIRTRGGLISTKLANKNATIISFLNGKSILHPNATHCHELGDMLAKMHVAAKSFKLTRKNDLSISGWEKLIRKIKKQPNTDDKAIKLIDSEFTYLSDNWPKRLPGGVIHADLFPNNVFFSDNKLSGIIDFYFACNDMLAYDLAICINSWCFDETTFNRKKFAAIISAYERIRKLTKKEKELFPILLRGSALRFLLTRYFDFLTHNPTDLVDVLDPNEYILKLQFHQQIQSFNDYF